MVSKTETALRQGYQGLTLGFGDEMIDVLAARIASISPDLTYSQALTQARELTKKDNSADFKENPKTAIIANILGSLPSGIAGGAKVLPQIALSSAAGFGSSDGNLEGRTKDAGIGAAFGLGGQLLSKGASRVTKGLSDAISPEAKKAAVKLKSLGIPVRLSQLMDSKFLSSIDMALSRVPFSGAGKSQEAQRKAFTKALSNTFGENADTITDEVLGAAKTRLGGSYDALLKNTDIPIDRQAFAQQLSQLIDDLSLETDDAGAAFLSKQADNILNTIDNNGGKLTGQAYQKLRQTLKGAKGTNFSVGQIQKLVDDTVRNSVPQNIGKQLGQIDSQYRNMKIAEKLYGQQQNSSGTFRPETLYNAAKPNISTLAYGGGGELGDLARAGRQLKPTIPDSGTATQALGMGALGASGVGAFLEPTIALGALGTVGTARGLNSAMSSKYLQEGMNPAIQAGAELVKNSGAIPSLLRSGQNMMQSNAQQPQDDFSDIEAILNQPQDDFSDIEAILNNPQKTMTEAQSQEIIPTQSSPFLDRVAMAESGGNPNARAKTSSASGMYQFTDPTWKGMVKNYGAQTGITEADKNNPEKQKIMADLLTKENANAYKSAGITPDETDLYMAHFLGAPSAVRARKNMNAYGAELFPKAAQANKNIFYKNGKPRTVEEIRSLLGTKIGA